jgi:hypothetical protein
MMRVRVVLAKRAAASLMVSSDTHVNGPMPRIWFRVVYVSVRRRSIVFQSSIGGGTTTAVCVSISALRAMMRRPIIVGAAATGSSTALVRARVSVSRGYALAILLIISGSSGCAVHTVVGVAKRNMD